MWALGAGVRIVRQVGRGRIGIGVTERDHHRPRERTAQIRAEGLAAYADSALHRQLGPRWRDSPHAARLRGLITGTDPEGWAGCAAAIGGTDFYTTTASLRLPALVIAGANDGSTPPDLVRETADLIPGHHFKLMQGVGHLPMVEQPEAYAAVLKTFWAQIGHI
jgi:3-oxoadipate enol-lactonase